MASIVCANKVGMVYVIGVIVSGVWGRALNLLAMASIVCANNSL